jgi:hypothetical protein
MTTLAAEHAEADAGTTAVREAHRFDEPALAVPAYDFYVAFNFFRFAAIMHGIKGRVMRGTAASAEAEERIKVVPEIAELAWRQAVRAGAS